MNLLRPAVVLACALALALAGTAAVHADPLADGRAAYARGDLAAARQQLEPAAGRGDAEAQTLLGLMHLEGRGVTRDETRGVALIRGAADAGHAHARFLLGSLHDAGRGVAADATEAARWYRLAAEQGHATAQGRLGAALARGRGVVENDTEAAEWWRRGAAQGDADSQGLLGIAHYDGEGVPLDKPRAYHWLLLAAAQPGESSFRYQRFRDRVEHELTEAQRAAARDEARAFVAAGSQVTLPDIARAPATAATPGTTPGAAPSPPLAPPAPSRQGRSTGSGIVIAADRVVTNHHVSALCRRVTIDGYDAKIVASDPRADLALLEWPGRGSLPATLRTGRANVGETATAAGFPLSGILSGFSVTTGIVSSLGGMHGDRRLLQFSAPVQSGNSGGPLLDAHGQVIGVVVAKLNAMRVQQLTGDVPQNVNFAITADVLASFLGSHGVTPTAASPLPIALSTQDVARRAQGFTVLVECWK